jgi:hypothetical protein
MKKTISIEVDVCSCGEDTRYVDKCDCCNDLRCSKCARYISAGKRNIWLCGLCYNDVYKQQIVREAALIISNAEVEAHTYMNIKLHELEQARKMN